ncbi:esterase FE4-like isoform X2 [Ceratina calcarata]|uniref:Esterase FE4-like isoform X2 n=1 Tax=Ceratina calcarata TaxID=156304 RepID=A0AAJ7S4R8_9HYME|nr:esterase FE4-like isoform X2 [Ceratina calcarata]
MKFLDAVSFCIIGIGCVFCCTAQPEVTAPIGRIHGSIIRSRLGREIYSFRGVRYAEPPTGERRFQIPVPAADWDDVFDASQEGPACPNLRNTNISEDCLRLNVYTTKLPSERENPNRSVLVYFHPGGFYDMSGQSLYWGPQYLLDQDVVLVTVNNRLGSLGFISTGDSLAPGNLGFKDQVIALRWIQRNIAAFGGDPNSVTISGCSIGGTSVMLHMVSPMSKGLFHRAIVMSGELMINEPYPTDQMNLAQKQARILDCPTDNSTVILNCLRSRPVENFRNTLFQFFEVGETPVVIWKAVVEPEIPGIERFLPAQPVDLIQRGEFFQVPTMFGVTKDEIACLTVMFNNLSKIGIDMYGMYEGRWYHEAPVNLVYEEGTPRSRNISDQLRQFYFNDQPFSSDNGDNFTHLMSDGLIIFPMYRAAKLIAQNSKEPLYFYESTYQGRYSMIMLNATTPYASFQA